MKKLKVAITFLKFLPVPSLHSFMLTKAVEQVDPISVQRLLNSSVVDRFSELDQSLSLTSALKSLLNGQHKDVQSRTNARTICHMLLDRGIAFWGIYENRIVIHSTFLSGCDEDRAVLLKLCHAQMSDNTKIDTFARVVQHMPQDYNQLVTILYDLWKDVLKGPIEVSRLGWTRMISDTREGAPTLMEWCLWRAPEQIVLNLINDCDKIDAEECRDLLQRASVSFDILDALVDKGVDLHHLVKIAHRGDADMVTHVEAYRQHNVLKNVIGNTAPTFKRKI